MTGTKRIFLIATLALLALSVTACMQAPPQEDLAKAQEYCEGLGYKYAVVVTFVSGETHFCNISLTDQCPAESFLGGICGQEFTYCAQMGGTIEPAEEGLIGNCVFSDGTICNEYDLFTGACAPGGE